VEDAKRRLLDRLRKEIGDTKVVAAMERVPREAFVPAASAELAYEDAPLPIGEGQTISQPYIVAMMVSALELRRTDRVLEVGTGSGYQAAVLSCLASEVVTVERMASLADSARERLRTMGFSNVEVRLTGPELGWAGASPYDAIVVAAGAPRLARELIDQLVVGGRLIIPVGSKESQELMKVSRTADGFSIRTLGSCRFVPLIGPGAWPEDDSSSG
jgi:protein-L-isoaspartate(D-aspartate) O-methyltransferase